jgi:hypothetical protein
MGCGCGGEEKKETVAVEEEVKPDPNLVTIQDFIKGDKQGDWVMALYDAWSVDGEPTEVTMANGQKRKTWPMKWADLEAMMEGNGFGKEQVKAFHARLVENTDLPNITADCVTWPAIQNLTRDQWVVVNGPWIMKEHQPDGSPYRGLLRSNTLGSKKEGLSKMIKEKGDAFIDEMWKIYVAWPCPLDGVAHVQRYNRKKALKGEWCDSGKDTWPLNWSGDGSVEALLQECGWGEDVTGSLQNALFGGEAQSVYHVHPNCKEDQCCWPDLQSVFRFIIADGEPWTEELNGEYPPLDGRRATLRNKITKDQIKDVLEGDFRMYCMPPEESGQSAFSYGVVIKDVDVEAGTFGGHSATEGVYTIDEGKLLFDDKTGRLNVSYTEVWSNGARDALSARVKSNSKYQCESTSGYEQKASQGKNVPNSEEAPPGIKKYHDNSM